MLKSGMLALPPWPSSLVFGMSLPVARVGCCLSLDVTVSYSDYVWIVVFFHFPLDLCGFGLLLSRQVQMVECHYLANISVEVSNGLVQPGCIWV